MLEDLCLKLNEEGISYLSFDGYIEVVMNGNVLAIEEVKDEGFVVTTNTSSRRFLVSWDINMSADRVIGFLEGISYV